MHSEAGQVSVLIQPTSDSEDEDDEEGLVLHRSAYEEHRGYSQVKALDLEKRVEKEEKHPEIVQKLLEEFKELFDSLGECSKIDFAQHYIQLKEESKLCMTRAYKSTDRQCATLKEVVEEYLDHGWIRSSESEWGCLVVFAERKGKIRPCFDYKKVNVQTEVDRYLLPRIDVLLE